MTDSPSNQKMDRDTMNAFDLNTDVDLSEDEILSNKSQSVVTEDEVHMEVDGTRIVYIPKDSCRAVYKHKNHPRGMRPYICMNPHPCNKRLGGLAHHNLIKKNQASAGYYKGVYDKKVLKAGLMGSYLTESEVDEM